MRVLVIGAGASIAEGLAAGNALDDCLPVMHNFARKMWKDFNPHPLLDHFLKSIGYEPPKEDARPLFYELEDSGITNVERFFEFAWRNRNQAWLLSEYEAIRHPGQAATLKSVDKDGNNSTITNIPGQPLPNDFRRGMRIRHAGKNKISIEPAGNMSYWENMLYCGLGIPMAYVLMKNFFENGKGFKILSVSQSIASKLSPSDFVLNLNYDTVFEIALEQCGLKFTYSPAPKDKESLYICKPHGSLNLLVLEDGSGFAFGQPTWLGSPESPNGFSFQGLVPPRFSKSYEQNPISKVILNTLRHQRPNKLTMWGIGLTESDTDLMSLYLAWVKRGVTVEIVNPDENVAIKVQELLKCPVSHYRNHSDWLNAFREEE